MVSTRKWFWGESKFFGDWKIVCRLENSMVETHTNLFWRIFTNEAMWSTLKQNQNKTWQHLSYITIKHWLTNKKIVHNKDHGIKWYTVKPLLSIHRYVTMTWSLLTWGIFIWKEFVRRGSTVIYVSLVPSSLEVLLHLCFSDSYDACN